MGYFNGLLKTIIRYYTPSGSQLLIHKPSEEQQLRRTIDRVLADARRGQRLDLFKPAFFVPTQLDFEPFGECVKRLSLFNDQSYVAESAVQAA